MSTTVVVEGEAPAPDSPGEPPTGRRPWRAGLAVLLGVLALLGVAVTRPIGNVRAADTEHSQRNIAIGPLLPAQSEITQRFTASDDHLASISVAFGTFGNTVQCTLAATVVDSAGTTVGSEPLPCNTLRENRSTEVVRFDPPLAASQGQDYELRLDLTSGAAGPVVWGTAVSDGSGGAAYAGQPVAGRAEFATFYHRDGRVWSVLGTALHRMGEYGAVWNSPLFILLDVLVIAGLLVALAVSPKRTAGVLLVALAVSRGLLWGAVLPPFSGPDEQSHFAYSQVLAERHVPLKRDANDGLPGMSDELTQGILAFHTTGPGLDRPDYSGAGQRATEDVLHANTDRLSSQNSGAAGYAPVFYVVPAVLEKGPGTLDQRLGLMRLWSIVLGAAAVWLTYRIGLRLFGEHQGAAVLLGLAVAFQPMLTQQTTVLSNDAGLIAAGTLCLLLSLQLADRRRLAGWPAEATVAGRRLPVVPLAFWAGIALGAAMLSKQTGLAWAAVLGVAWLIGRRRAPGLPAWWREVVYAGVGVVVTDGLWVVYAKLARYPAPGFIGQKVEGLTLHDLWHGVSHNRFEVLRLNWLEQFWGTFSWLTVKLPQGAFWVIAIVMSALSVAMVVWVVWTGVDVVRWLTTSRAIPGGGDLAVNTGLCLLAIGATIGGLLAVMAQYFLSYQAFDLIQGRYALMMLPALLAMPALLLQRFVPRISPTATMAVVASSMAVLQALAIGVLVNSFYL